MNKTEIKEYLEEIYKKYNRKEFIERDPVKYVHMFSKAEDREIVGFIASTFSLGRVDEIFKALDRILSIIGESPYDFFMHEKNLFFREKDLEFLFIKIKSVLKKYGTFKNLFMKHWDSEKKIKYTLHKFVKEIGIENFVLLPDPMRGSSCKRLNMFLRWMVRKDEIDVGLWEEVEKSYLIIPLDTHVAKIGTMLGFTKRSSNDWKKAEEITNSLREFEPEDPLKYDFSICRAGMEGVLPFKNP